MTGKLIWSKTVYEGNMSPYAGPYAYNEIRWKFYGN